VDVYPLTTKSGNARRVARTLTVEGFADSVCLRVKCLGFGVFNVVERQVQRVPLSTHDDFLLCSNISRELSTIGGVVQY
jgi:hypothetical protein